MTDTISWTRTQPTRPAFTLIELLLAMLLSTVVLAALWSLLNIYTTLFNTASIETEQAQLARAVLVMIENDLVSVVPEPETKGASRGTHSDSLDTTDNDDTSSATSDDNAGSSALAAPTQTTDANAPLSDATEDTNAPGTGATSTINASDAMSSHLTGGVFGAESQRDMFAQPSLIGNSETLWLVVDRQRDVTDAAERDSFATSDTEFHPPEELAIVEYAATYRDATAVLGRVADTPLSNLASDETADGSSLDDASSTNGLETWQGLADADMESAASQLGPIDREVIDASRGLERREAAWPVPEIATDVAPAPLPPTESDGEESDIDETLAKREFLPPSRLADIQDRAGQSATTIDNTNAAAEMIDVTSSLTPEVVRLRFRYYDGHHWRSEWDSRAQGGLPRAVEIILAVLPTDQSAVDDELERFEENPTEDMSPWPVYRHVVVLPTARVRRDQQLDAAGVEVPPTSSNTSNDLPTATGGVDE